MGLELLEEPTEPVATTEEAQLQTRSENAIEEALLDDLVAAATRHAEAYCRRRFVSQKWRVTLDAFPTGGKAIRVPHPPLISVESVTYLDEDGQEQTLAATEYDVRDAETPGEIVLAYGKSWPSTRAVPDAVRVEFTCGYGAAANVPAPIRRAVLILAATMYANRESVVTGTIATEIPQSAIWLLGPYTVRRESA